MKRTAPAHIPDSSGIKARRRAQATAPSLPTPHAQPREASPKSSAAMMRPGKQDSRGVVRLPQEPHPWPWPCSGLPKLLSMGRSIFDPIWAIKDHASQGTELMFILRGRVTVHTAHYDLPATEGQVVYTPKGLIHRDDFPLDSQFEVYLVHFEWEGESAMLADVSPADLTRASKVDSAIIAADMRQLYADFLHPGPMTAAITSLRLMQVIGRLWHHARQARHPESETGYDLGKARRLQIMTQARHVIHERFSQPLGLEDIAAAIDVSPYYLSRVFSQEAGFTLSSYLHGVRMEKAISLLRDPRTAVGDVAHQVGFRDAHYFARVFRNHFGSSPSVYRTRLSPATL